MTLRRELLEALGVLPQPLRKIKDKIYPPALTPRELDMMEDVSRTILEHQDSLGGPSDKDVKVCFVQMRLIGMIREKQ